LVGAQPVTVASGQAYGERAEQVAAQRAIPLARAEGFQPAPSGGGGGGGGAPSGSSMTGPLPGQVVPLDAPSQRPDEPVTAGMAMGAGPGPEVLGPLAGMRDSVADELRAIYVRFPTEEMRSLLESLDDD
jgi:hypothetical protein